MQSATPIADDKTMSDALANALVQRRLVAFVGAGCSMIAPTSLPSWWNVNRATINAMAVEATAAIGDEDSDWMSRHIIARQQAFLLPSEYFADILHEVFGQAYFDVLRGLDSQSPNAAHAALVSLAQRGALRAIITTNFDRAVEAAFAAEGVSLRCIFREPDFEVLAGELHSSGFPDSCTLLKIHGCASDPSTMIDTLSQRKRGFPAPTRLCLAALLQLGHWVVLGYSGADLEADPQYFGLQAANGPGLTWLTRSGTKPLNAVVRLAEAVDNASIVYGELPGWLQLLTGAPIPQAPATSSPPATLPKADDWAHQQGPFACALALALLTQQAGSTNPAFHALENLAKAHPLAALDAHLDQSAGTVTFRNNTASAVGAYYHAAHQYSLLCHAMSVALEDRGNLQEALHWATRTAAVRSLMRDADGLAWSTADLGTIYRNAGQQHLAMVCFDKALEIATDPDTRALLGIQIAPVKAAHGRYDEARLALEDALPIVTKRGKEQLRSHLLHMLGKVENASSLSSSLDKAERHYLDALDIAGRLGDEGMRGQICIDLGRLMVRQNKLDQALYDFGIGGAVGGKILDLGMLLRAETGSAIAYAKKGNESMAMLHLNAARFKLTKTQSAFDSVVTLDDMADCYRLLGHYQDALTCRGLARDLAKDTHDTVPEARILRAAADDARLTGDVATAVSYLREAQTLFTQCGLHQDARTAARAIGEFLLEGGSIDLARQHFELMLSDSSAAEADPEWLAVAHLGLSDCAFGTGDTDEGTAQALSAIEATDTTMGPGSALMLGLDIIRHVERDFNQPAAMLRGDVSKRFAAAAENAQHLIAEHNYVAAKELLYTLAHAGRDERNLDWLGTALSQLGNVALQTGDTVAARHHYTSALVAFLQLYDSEKVSSALGSLMDLLRSPTDHLGLATALQWIADECEKNGDETWAAQLRREGRRVTTIQAEQGSRSPTQITDAIGLLQLQRPQQGVGGWKLRLDPEPSQ